jgi:hypothetical protein
MDVPKLYRISAEVERDQRVRFRVFSKSQGRTMRAQLTYMVSQAIAGVELPKEQALPAKAAVARALTEEERIDQVYLQSFGVPRPKPEAEAFVLDPDERYWESRDSGLTREQSIARVQFAIEANKYTKEWVPPVDDESEGNEEKPS